MKGSSKWIVVAVFWFVLSFFYDPYGIPSVLVWISMLGVAYCLGMQVVEVDFAQQLATGQIGSPKGLNCENCGQTPHLTEVHGYWLCDDCSKRTTDPHCPRCGVLIEPDSNEARINHMIEKHGASRESFNIGKPEGAA